MYLFSLGLPYKPVAVDACFKFTLDCSIVRQIKIQT